MKLFLAGLATETNTFSPIASGWSHWHDARSVFRTDGMLELAEKRGWQVIFGPVTDAHPGGITPRQVYEGQRKRILDALNLAAPVDAVLLILHGAMVADGYPDCEGDLIAHIRNSVGPNVPIGAELDLHAHLTQSMLDTADLLVGYKEYPHTDVEEQLFNLFRLLADTAERKVNPVMRSFDCRMIHLYPTTVQPMQAFVDSMRATETQPNVLNAWLCHGFPWGDVREAGARMVVTTDNDPDLARSLAEQLGKKFYAMRADVARKTDSMAQCIDAATGQAGPVTIADTADNSGGGAPSDATFALRQLVDGRISSSALGPLFDPGAVEICHDAGKGSRIELRIGGKLGPSSGDPMDVTATVIGLADEVTQALGNTLKLSLGRCAAIRIHLDREQETPDTGVEVVLSQERVQAFAPNLFTELGIDPTSKQVLVVKSTQHFYAAFARISNAILYAGDQGALQGDIKTIRYRALDTSRMWPMADDPLGLASGTPSDQQPVFTQQT